ncbi:MAG: FadR family transcriptional regulator [Alicyclobacillus sp.]|nr:FadR family transcriptional regulator [Alicyclobacillus sp.]
MDYPHSFKPKPLKGKRLPETIAEQLRNAIRNGEFGPVDRLPTTRFLATSYGVSTAVIREALTILRQRGLIEVVHGVGIFARNNIEHLLEGELNQIELNELDELIRLLEVRLGIESEAARLAAERCTEDDLAKIRNAYLAMCRDVEEGRLGNESDYAFHHAIAEATHNPLFVRLESFIGAQLKRGIAVSRARSKAILGRTQVVLQEHLRILESISSRDSEASYAAMRAHISAARDRLLEGHVRDV